MAQARNKKKQKAKQASNAARSAAGGPRAKAEGPQAATRKPARAQAKDAAQQPAFAQWYCWMPAVLVCLLVLFQGGYYAGATCVIGLLATLAFALRLVLARGQAQGLPAASLVFLALGVLCLASSLVHGATLTMLQHTGSWFALAGMALWCTLGTEAGRRQILDNLALAGAVLSAAGILMFAGILPVPGAVNADRLMFTFQYANAAGLFFATIAVLCLASARRNLRFAALLPVAALALTQSGGAIVVFALACVVLALRWVRERKPVPSRIALGAAGAIAVCIGAAVLLSSRIAQASQTFIERIVQHLDGFSLLAGNLLLGIGPEQWQFAYPAIQTAQYRAADLHGSYLQLALDGGLLALALLLALVVFGFVLALRRGEFASCVCLAMVGLHMLIDFDIRFAAIALLLAVLAGSPAAGDGEASGRVAERLARPWLSAVVAACAIAASALGVLLDVQANHLMNAAEAGRAEDAHAALQSSAYLQADPIMQVHAAGALLAAGNDEAALLVLPNDPAALENAILYRVLAHHRLGDEAAACEALHHALQAQPYNVELFEGARQLVEDAGLGPQFADVYNAAAQQANQLATQGHAAWLSSQKAIEQIG